MQKTLFSALMIALLIVTLLTGCAANSVEQPAIPTQPPTQAQEKNPPATEPQRLTREEAISIALGDAGLTQDQITGLRAEFDYEDGVPEYEVEFRHGGYEYDYKIHAETGVIRFRDKDRID